ncbi:hypothetical protein LTV02_12965 [Nocardia yamanashiensis]|uniref:hypothetical protein n=1 Tax=Nocardia yamanashiensis TaxID=209247 RepID=UPI001E5061C5|nr:hypothetical protein [Nocardia yamanashiensis]UGT44240.1 hypothetical protein LTV02_12965 [Nocardia yamanashiensis]
MTRIGVAGHMNITADTAVLVYDEITRMLAAAGPSSELVGISCIARGADSVFAQAVLDLGGRLEVVLPCRSYRERKVKPDHAEQFDALLARADVVNVLDFDVAGAEAYEAANESLVGSSDRLIAVWDGKPSEQGGTGTVVEFAQSKGVPVDVVWPAGSTRA